MYAPLYKIWLFFLKSLHLFIYLSLLILLPDCRDYISEQFLVKRSLCFWDYPNIYCNYSDLACPRLIVTGFLLFFCFYFLFQFIGNFTCSCFDFSWFLFLLVCLYSPSSMCAKLTCEENIEFFCGLWLLLNVLWTFSPIYSIHRGKLLIQSSQRVFFVVVDLKSEGQKKRCW